MIKEIKVTKKFPFNKEFTISCKNVNLLVGEQGVGKSTLLEWIRDNSSNLEISFYSKVDINGIVSYYFDSEKMNPRVQDINSITNPDGTTKGIGLGNLLISKFKSHGETLKKYTVDALPKAKDCVLLLDEPETGLSIKNQYKLATEIKDLKNRKCQVFIATHSIILIQEIGKVFCLDNYKELDSDTYISENK